MTNERAAKIVLDLINAGEAEYRYFSVEEIIAFKKAYVALNPEPVTNADRIRSMTDEELSRWISETKITGCPGDLTYKETMCDVLSCYDCWLDWLKRECSP